MAAKKIVEQFIGTLENFEQDQASALLDDDCIYRNVPFHTAVGRSNIERDLGLMMKGLDSFSVEMISIAVNGNVVLTERLDKLRSRGFRLDLPVMWAFIVRNGKIQSWKDYFDWTSLLGGVAGGLPVKILRRWR